MSMRDRLRAAPAPCPAPAADPRAEALAARALAAKRGRMTISAPPNAGKSLAAVLRPLTKNAGLGLGELKRRWVEIAGESFSRAAPLRLHAGVLTLQAPSALAPFLQQQAPLLMERLKTAGAKIKSVRIEQRAAAPARPAGNVAPLKAAPLSPVEEAALAQALDPVGDPALKMALLWLGRAVRQG